MRVVEIKACEFSVGHAKCPFFEQTAGYYRWWVCRHPEFRGGINAPKHNMGKIRKDGGYPTDASKKVASGCPLKKL
jgi:hypothetical protein